MAEHSHDSERVREVSRQVGDALLRSPSGLLTDIDGTISEMAATPGAAFIVDAAREALADLRLNVSVVGAVSGRAAADARRMLDLPSLLYIGNHGFESIDGGVQSVVGGAEESVQSVQEALSEIQAEISLAEIGDGVLIENKRFTGSIHYRLVARPETAHPVVSDIVRRAAARHGLRTVEGRMVVELRPDLLVNKGTAIDAVIAVKSLASLVFLGDDVTDIDGFRAIARHRADASFKGLTVAVVSPDSNPLVGEAADVVLHGVGECVATLRRVAEIMRHA